MAMFEAQRKGHPSADETIKKVLQEFVNIDEELETRNKIIMTHVTKHVIQKMKTTSPLFQYLYREIFYTGSYYDNLRVKQANEFDLDLILDLPFTHEQYTVNPAYQQGYVQYYLNKPVEISLARLNKADREFLINNKFPKTMFNGDRKLMQNKIIEWLQQIIDLSGLKNATVEIPVSDHTYIYVALTFRRSGPAWTLNVLVDAGDVIDVDLVLAIALDKWPNLIKKKNWIQFITTNEEKLCMLIPKASKISTDPFYEWRISLPRIERFLLQDKQCVKPLIRIVKALRDAYDWKCIASYHIKTLFLHAIEANYNNEVYWNMKNVQNRLLDMLGDLQVAVARRQLPNFFFPGDNMFAHIDDSTAAIISNTLSRIISTIRADFSKLYDIFYARHYPSIHRAIPEVVEHGHRSPPADGSWCNIL